MNMPNKKEDREMSRKGRTFPGFNAEAVFYRTSNQYRHDSELAHQDSCITPAMICFSGDDSVVAIKILNGTSCPARWRHVLYTTSWRGDLCVLTR